MVITIDQIEKYLGQSVRDEYGRTIGKLLAIYAQVTGEVEFVDIAINETIFEKIEACRIKLTPDGVVVIPVWKVKALDIENRLDRVRRRMRSIEELYRKGMVPTHAYEEIKKSLDAQLKMLKDEVRNIREMLRKRVSDLEDQMIRLEKDMANLMMLYMSNEVSESAYKLSMEFLRSAKARNMDEKKDVEKHIELISRLESEATEVRPLEEQKKVQEVQVPQQGGPIQVQIVET